MTVLRAEQIAHDVPAVVIAPGFHGHAIARSLGRLGVPVYGVHGDRRSPAARSRYWRANYFHDLSADAPEAALAWLLDLGGKIGGRPLLIPTDDHSCVLLADYTAKLSARFRIPQQPTGLTRRLSDKKEMYFLCKQVGIPAAETSFPQCRADVEEFARTARFPVMLKGIDTVAVMRRTGVKMVVAHDADELLRRYDQMESPETPSLMLQEYLPGGSQAVCMFNGYFDDQSRCLFGETGHMIRQYPAYTGRTSLGIVMSNEVVAEQTRRLMGAVGYRGPLDIGYKHDPRTGEYRTIDINPRTGATFRLFVDSNGMDVVRAMYLDLTGQAVPAGEACEGRKWLVENFDAVSSPRYIRDGVFSVGSWLKSYRGVRETQWFALDDPRPFFSMAWVSLRRGPSPSPSPAAAAPITPPMPTSAVAPASDATETITQQPTASM